MQTPEETGFTSFPNRGFLVKHPIMISGPVKLIQDISIFFHISFQPTPCFQKSFAIKTFTTQTIRKTFGIGRISLDF